MRTFQDDDFVLLRVPFSVFFSWTKFEFFSCDTSTNTKKRRTHLSAQVCFTDVLAEGNSNLSQNSPLLQVQRICRKIRCKRSKMLWQISVQGRIPPSSRVSTEMTFRDLDFNKFYSFFLLYRVTSTDDPKPNQTERNSSF